MLAAAPSTTRQDLQFGIEIFDAAEATKVLEQSNTHNRNLHRRKVTAIAADMAAGTWHQSGDSIKFATDGTLIDGQHRLQAIIVSDTIQELLVVRGLPMEVQDVVDTGTKRSFADVLQIHGEERCSILASITRRSELWERGMRGSQVYSITPTTSQLLQRLEDHPELRESAALANHVYHKIRIPASTLGFSHWLFGQVKTSTPEEEAQLKEDVETFFARLRDGDGLTSDHPIAVLRRTMYENVIHAKSRYKEEVLLAMVIKAWNAYREGRKISMLRFRPGGANPESFPEPI